MSLHRIALSLLSLLMISSSAFAQVQESKNLSLEEKIDQVFGHFVQVLAGVILWDVVFWDNQSDFKSRTLDVDSLKKSQNQIGKDLQKDPIQWGFFSRGQHQIVFWNDDGQVTQSYSPGVFDRYFVSNDGLKIFTANSLFRIGNLLHRNGKTIANLDFKGFSSANPPDQMLFFKDFYLFSTKDHAHYVLRESQLQALLIKYKDTGSIPTIPVQKTKPNQVITQIKADQDGLYYVAFDDQKVALCDAKSLENYLDQLSQGKTDLPLITQKQVDLKSFFKAETQSTETQKLLGIGINVSQNTKAFWALFEDQIILLDQNLTVQESSDSSNAKSFRFSQKIKKYEQSQDQLMLTLADQSLIRFDLRAKTQHPIIQNVLAFDLVDSEIFALSLNTAESNCAYTLQTIDLLGQVKSQKPVSIEYIDCKDQKDIAFQLIAKKNRLFIQAQASSADENHPLKSSVGQSKITTLQIEEKTPITVPLIVLWLVLGATYFTIRTRFANLRLFKHAIDILRGKYDDDQAKGEVSHFQALTSALSATVGLGNIAGVAIAISIGGPGACFWLIVAGFLGMSSKFAECTLGQKYRTLNAQGEVMGGAMHYLSTGIQQELGKPKLGKALAILFCFLCIGGSFGGGNAFQVKQSLSAIEQTIPFFKDYHWVYGLIMMICTGAVILGGIKRIATTAEKIVPLMCAIYLIGCAIIIAMCYQEIPNALMSIVKGAFMPNAIYGGLLGVLVVGFQRAAFSNEAGIGSAAIAHAAAKSSHPVKEGIVALLEPFIDTIVVCTFTALVMVVTHAYDNPIYGEIILKREGAALTSKAMGEILPWFPYFLSFAVFLFAYSTMISWSYYGERCWSWLFGEKAVLINLGKHSSTFYRLIFLAFVFLGAIIHATHILDFSDLMILGMAIPNMLGLILLSNGILKDLKDYEDHL